MSAYDGGKGLGWGENSESMTLVAATAESAELALVVASETPQKMQIDAGPPILAWDLCRALEFQVLARVPLEDMSLGEVLEIRVGTLLHSSWPADSDVVLSVKEAELGRGSIEPAENGLGFRLNNLTEMDTTAGASPRPNRTRGRNYRSGTEGLSSVMMGVSICIGSKSMRLEEILNMTLGDLLPFDRRLSEDVTLVVNHRTFAAGQLLLVNGSYAIEITQINAGNLSVFEGDIMHLEIESGSAGVIKAHDLTSSL